MEYKEINNIKYPQNLSPEKQAIIDMLARNYAQEVAGIDEEKNRNLNKLRTGAAIEIASAAIPGTAGAKLAGSTVKALAPFVSKKIASEIGTGLVGGGLSGAVFGSGRGLMEDKNPVETAAYDALIGAALGGVGGAAMSKAGDFINKNVILPAQRKMRMQNAVNDKVNPLAKAYNNVFYDTIDDMRKELPKYIDVEVEKPSFWGGVKSNEPISYKQKNMLNTLYNTEMQNGKSMSLEELKKHFSTRADEELQKIYDMYINKNYEVIKPFEAAKKVTEQHINPEYRPLYKQSSNDDIIDFYNSMSDTDKIGHGYKGYSMSNNAASAYDRGNMPLSKWNKENILNRIKEIGSEFDIPINEEVLKKMPLKDLKEQFLQKNGYHHTSKFYNSTDFYKVNIEKLLEQAEK